MQRETHLNRHTQCLSGPSRSIGNQVKRSVRAQENTTRGQTTNRPNAQRRPDPSAIHVGRGNTRNPHLPRDPGRLSLLTTSKVLKKPAGHHARIQIKHDFHGSGYGSGRQDRIQKDLQRFTPTHLEYRVKPYSNEPGHKRSTKYSLMILQTVDSKCARCFGITSQTVDSKCAAA